MGIYQEELVTVYTRENFIVLPYWQNRLPGLWFTMPLSHIILIVTVHTHKQFNSATLLVQQTTSTMTPSHYPDCDSALMKVGQPTSGITHYLTPSHYPDTEQTSPCPINSECQATE